MPRYDYKCNRCDERFEVSLSVKEKESTTIICPKCKSEDTSQIFGVVGINTKYSSKQSPPGCSRGCCSNCELSTIHNH